MKHALYSFLFVVFVGVLGIFAQGNLLTYEQVRAKQDKLPEITASMLQNWKDCRRLYSEARNYDGNSSERRSKIEELRVCFQQSQKYRDDFVIAASPVFFYKELEANELTSEGWTTKQVKEVGKWWDKIRDLLGKIKNLDRGGPSFGQVSDFLEKFA